MRLLQPEPQTDPPAPGGADRPGTDSNAHLIAEVENLRPRARPQRGLRPPLGHALAGHARMAGHRGRHPRPFTRSAKRTGPSERRHFRVFGDLYSLLVCRRSGSVAPAPAPSARRAEAAVAGRETDGVQMAEPRERRCLARHGGAYGTGIEEISAARFRARILSSRTASLCLPCLGCAATLPGRGLCPAAGSALPRLVSEYRLTFELSAVLFLDLVAGPAGLTCRRRPLIGIGPGGSCGTPGMRTGLEICLLQAYARMGFRLWHAHSRVAYEMAWLLSCRRAWSVSAWAAGLVGSCSERQASLRRARSSGRVILTAWTSGA